MKAVKGNAIVPSYVLEYLLGQYCATNDEATIQTGIETVKDILRKHYVHRNEAKLVQSNIKEKGRYKIIDRVSVILNDKKDAYEASFANLGVKNVLIDSATIKKHPKLLVGGVWCICDIEYFFSEETDSTPWVLDKLKPIQLSHFDFQEYLDSRSNFTTDEWIDMLIQSIGFNPEYLGRRNKLIQLQRLIPFVERNYNLIELGPKGTGKSHIFSEFSPHGILISGGEVTVPKLFVNNSTGNLGLVGYWDVVAFDELAGKGKRVDKALVDIMKNYMANKSFSRGIETLGAEASMVFIGNTKHNVPYMLKNSDFYEELPDKYYDPAFIDRLHNYLPGWEVDVIRSEMFTSGYGFVVDYIAEILKHLRGDDFSDRYQSAFDLSSDISTRDRDGVNKTFSGLMKIIFPTGEASDDEIKEILTIAVEGRKRVKDQLMRIDDTFPETDFSFKTKSGEKIGVKTLEEIQHPNFYYKSTSQSVENEVASGNSTSSSLISTEENLQTASLSSALEPRTGHHTYAENETGISFEHLFGDHLIGAQTIEIQDPYIRAFHQCRNIMEFVELLVILKDPADAVSLKLTTSKCEFSPEKQDEFLTNIQRAASSANISFAWEYDDLIHARHITTDTGWKISLDRGLDIFQRYEMNDSFSLGNRLQEQRSVKQFEIIYLKGGQVQ